jgi:lambda family phage portal protein
MGVPLATGAIKTYRTNVVGPGLKMKSRIDYATLGISEEEAQETETKIEHEFALWADTEACDIERIDNFYEIQQLAFLNWLLSGDVIVTLPTTKRANVPYDLRIRLIEADRVCNPYDRQDQNITGGIETNDDGEVVAYHIKNTHPLSFGITNAAKAAEWARVAAFGEKTGRRNVLHIMNRERIGQRRGVPVIAPVIEALKQIGRYTDAELVAAVVAGNFSIFIEKDAESSEAPIGTAIPENEQVDAHDENSLELSPGAILDLAPGEHAKDVKPERPNSNFDSFVVAICRQIGMALETPYEVLLKHFSSSYSASRAALLEFWKSVNMYRQWLTMDFCQPIFEEWLAEAVAKGRISAPGFFASPIIRKAYGGAEWHGPAHGALDPTKEVQAAELRVKGGFSTRDRETRELTGGDFFGNMRQRKREEKLIKEVRDIEQTKNK